MSKQVTVIIEGKEYTVEVGDLSESPVRATVGKRTYQVEVPGSATSTASKPAVTTAPAAPVSKPTPAPKATPMPAAGAGVIIAPMPGDIIEVKVKPGDQINPGDVVCVLEAMKMKNMIRSARAGLVTSVEVAAGQAVDYGAVLVTLGD
jgi:biotin carboxyl carrier protein